MSSAYIALQLALEDLAEMNRQPPCHGDQSDLWISDYDDDREEAARLCRRCPLVPECLAAAKEQRATAGVWGAQPFGQATRRPKGKTA
jgi:WhiB family redox-sensing transcriptional regulator